MRTRLQLGVCETLLPDIMAPEVYQNDHSYVREFSRPTFSSLCKNFAWCGYTEDLKKPQNCLNLRVGACAGMGTSMGMGACRDKTVPPAFKVLFSFHLGCG